MPPALELSASCNMTARPKSSYDEDEHVKQYEVLAKRRV